MAVVTRHIVRHSAALALAMAASMLALSVHPRGQANDPSSITLSIVSTTDLHGYVLPREDGSGGAALLGGYVKNLRQRRAEDGGAVLLVDSGDTFQGGIESDLTEGALVIDAYNALGYNAATIGNHEFEFGPVDLPGAREKLGSDPRGALKARIAQARFPYLAANLIDDLTGHPIDWPNVRPSTLTTVDGIRIGLIGITTIDALQSTLPVNVHGLSLAPLVPTIIREAQNLREAGAEVVVVVAHAGGGCSTFSNPRDLSVCDNDSEIFRVARALPAGLVDVIAAGHTHDGLAQIVNDVAIVQGYALGRLFARVDLSLDRATHRILEKRPFAPRELCAHEDPLTFRCDARSLAPARYEGQAVFPDPAIDAAMAPELEHVRDIRRASLGVAVESVVRRSGDIESPLGNLFSDAIREGTPGADVGINNNARGGLRADLPAGPLTFGSLYDVFPFDNRLVTVTMTGAELRQFFAGEMRRGRRGVLGVSGIRVLGACDAGNLQVDLFRPSGRTIAADEQLVVATMDTLAAGAVFLQSAPLAQKTDVSEDAPIFREVVEDWIRQHRGDLRPEEFIDPQHPRWVWPELGPNGCLTQ